MTKKTTTAQKHGQNRLKTKIKAKRLAGMKLKVDFSAPQDLKREKGSPLQS